MVASFQGTPPPEGFEPLRGALPRVDVEQVAVTRCGKRPKRTRKSSLQQASSGANFHLLVGTLYDTVVLGHPGGRSLVGDAQLTAGSRELITIGVEQLDGVLPFELL